MKANFTTTLLEDFMFPNIDLKIKSIRTNKKTGIVTFIFDSDEKGEVGFSWTGPGRNVTMRKIND